MSSLLLPLFGDNDGTVFTDYSEHAHTVARFGNPVTTTSDAKYYGSSLRLPGNIGDYLEVADNALFQLDDGDFTIELWAKGAPETASDLAVYVGRHEGVALKRSWMIYQAASTIRFLCSPDGGTPLTLVNAGVALSSTNFTHIAVTRSGTSLRIFINGVLLGTTTLTGSIYQGTDIPVRVGCEGAVGNQSGFFDGYINDLRITKGTALYTENFTPPLELYSEPGPEPEPEPEPEAPDIDPDNGMRFVCTINVDQQIILPVANLVARLRSGSPSYLQVTVPFTAAMADAISTNSTEDISLWIAGSDTPIVTGAIDSIQISRGVATQSILVSARRQTTNGTPATHQIANPMAIQDGTTNKTILVPGFNPAIRPGDTVEHAGRSFVVGLATLTASARSNGVSIQTVYSSAGA